MIRCLLTGAADAGLCSLHGQRFLFGYVFIEIEKSLGVAADWYADSLQPCP